MRSPGEAWRKWLADLFLMSFGKHRLITIAAETTETPCGGSFHMLVERCGSPRMWGRKDAKHSPATHHPRALAGLTPADTLSLMLPTYQDREARVFFIERVPTNTELLEASNSVSEYGPREIEHALQSVTLDYHSREKLLCDRSNVYSATKGQRVSLFAPRLEFGRVDLANSQKVPNGLETSEVCVGEADCRRPRRTLDSGTSFSIEVARYVFPGYVHA